MAVTPAERTVAGMSTNDGGLVVDVRPMKHVEVDPTTRQARVGAGVTWGELDRAAQDHGLATTGGRVSTTGVAGFTLGGGSGWLERSCGLACDNLVSVDLVTADGRHVTASEDENPELFWGLHGGGGNFGVATSFVFRLHPVGPIVTAGLLLWPGEAATDVARLYRDVAGTARRARLRAWCSSPAREGSSPPAGPDPRRGGPPVARGRRRRHRRDGPLRALAPESTWSGRYRTRTSSA